MSESALEALTIVDLCEGGAGSYAAQLLAQCGAEVIKVEHPPKPRGASNAGKLSLSLDYGSAAGASLLATILENCDGVVEDSSSPRSAQSELTSENLIARAPRLVICRVIDLVPRSDGGAGSRGGAVTGTTNDLPDFEAVHGLSAFAGFLAGLWRAAQTEHGQEMEVRGAEALASLAEATISETETGLKTNLDGAALARLRFWEPPTGAEGDSGGWPAYPFSLATTPPAHGPEPERGEHTAYVLETYAGVSEGQMAALRREAVIG